MTRTLPLESSPDRLAGADRFLTLNMGDLAMLLQKPALCLGAAFLLTAAPVRASETFAAVGAKATLTVEYVYESSGKKADKHDSHEWSVRRMVNLSADLAARAPTPLPTLQALDATQTATLQKQAAQAQKAAVQMAPLMASVEQIMAKCGEDEKCIERESMKMGAAMSGTPQLEATLATGRETTRVLQPGAPRYQSWHATAQSGRYEIDESAKIIDADPLCMTLPGGRCKRDEKRHGSGAAPGALPDAVKAGLAGGVAAVELDTAKSTLVVRLPVPLNVLPYSETITTDKPGEAPGSRGAQPRQYDFRAIRDVQPITVALKGNWRNQSGEQVVAITGKAGEGGKLTIRWRLSAS